MSGGRSVPGKWAVLALRGSQTCHLPQCGQNLQTWLRPSCASSFTISSASKWSLVPTRLLYFEIVLKGMNPNPKALGMGTCKIRPPTFHLPALATVIFAATTWKPGDHSLKAGRPQPFSPSSWSPSLHPHGPLLAGKQVSWDRGLVIGWIQVDPHAIQIFHTASRPVFVWVWLSSVSRGLISTSSCLQSPPHPSPRDSEGSWTFLNGPPGLSSAKESQGSPWEVRHTLSNSGRLRGTHGPLPTPRAALNIPSFLTQKYSASGHRAGARGTYFPPATSKKKIIFYNCWNPDWAVKSTWNQLHEW